MVHGLAAERVFGLKNPMVGNLPRCCARAASGHAAAAPPSSVMNSRRSHSITSSAAQEQGRHGEPERLGGREIDDKLKLRGLLDGQIGGFRAS